MTWWAVPSSWISDHRHTPTHLAGAMHHCCSQQHLGSGDKCCQHGSHRSIEWIELSPELVGCILLLKYLRLRLSPGSHNCFHQSTPVTLRCDPAMKRSLPKQPGNQQTNSRVINGGIFLSLTLLPWIPDDNPQRCRLGPPFAATMQRRLCSS